MMSSDAFNEMEQHWSYDLLKHIAINDKLAQENLEDMKTLFRDEIGSDRKMSRIKTIDDLIDCLERHDVLSEANIEPLREIADQYADKALEEAVSSYICPKAAMTCNEPYNEYREIRLAEELRNNLSINGQRYAGGDHYGPPGEREIFASLPNSQRQRPQPPTAPEATPTPYAQPFTDRKRAAIYKYVAENIGKFWRSLGRELELKQGQMDELEMQYPRDLVSRVHKMLQMFEEDESQDPRRLVLTLCRALEESRRKDMRRKIEEMMSH